MVDPVPEEPDRDFSASIPELTRWEAARHALPNVRSRVGVAAIDPRNHDFLVATFRHVASRFGTGILERPAWDELIGQPPRQRPLPLSKKLSPVVVAAACSRDRELWNFLIAGGRDENFVVNVRASRYFPTVPHSSILDTSALPLVRTAVAVGMEQFEALSGAAYMFVPYSRSAGRQLGTEVMLSPRAFAEAEMHLVEAAKRIMADTADPSTHASIGVQNVPASILLWHSLQVVACDAGPSSQIVGIRSIEVLPKQRLRLEVTIHDPALAGVVLPGENEVAPARMHPVHVDSVFPISRIIHFGVRDVGSFAFAERAA